MNLVLIGFRATGKSTIARLLAEKLGLTLICMDREIEKRTGLSIKELVRRSGWDAFRELETELALELRDRDGLVIDTGGGVVTRPENIDALRCNGRLFWLQAPQEVIVSRLEGGTDRPSLTGRTPAEEAARLLKERTPLYRAAADYEVSTEDQNPRQSGEAIMALWESAEARL